MTTIKLTRQEMRTAAYTGVERNLHALSKNLVNLYGATERKTEWQNDVVGAIGEYALAKFLNVYWNPAIDTNLNDLPGDVGMYQVRSTGWPNGCLLMHPSDNDQAPFILAVVEGNTVTLKGWLYGYEGKAVGEIKDPKTNTYWVSQDNLHPMDRLP
jgi:hypothetical protein